MTSFQLNNPFQLSPMAIKPRRSNTQQNFQHFSASNTSSSVNQQKTATPVFSESRAFGAAKMARFMASDSYQATWEQDLYQSQSAGKKSSPIQNRSSHLMDTAAGVLQSLSFPARKRDAASLASDAWLPDAASLKSEPTLYNDLNHGSESSEGFEQPSTGIFSQIKDSFLDLFFEPAVTLESEANTQTSASEISGSVVKNSATSQDRPIGIAQLSRNRNVGAGPSAASAMKSSRLERLKQNKP